MDEFVHLPAMQDGLREDAGLWDGFDTFDKHRASSTHRRQILLV